LKEVDGLSYQEIADSVGCTIGTVMSRLFYARKRLQTLLQDVYENRNQEDLL
jgi:RNA polymerase sigma-70 factor (ECF subfamily)